ncbi:MAG: autotransporter strand-loop-strand O-heptosyltransferase [Selenomonadaceae bacterium]|nr:autotransporter strand-loop-strand O-heptosyltransferase [Selenomonadaceae bacterium]
MNVRYFSAPRLRDYLPSMKLGTLDFLGESPAVRPLAVQTTFEGLSFDFNMGLRLQIPAGNWHVTIFDCDSAEIFFNESLSDTLLISLEKFFVRWGFIIRLDGEIVFTHKFSPEDKKIHVYFPSSGMGDRIVYFPYMEAFRKTWNCKVSCTVEPYLQEIIELYYPEIEVIPPPADSYATYFIAPGFSPLFYPEEIRKVTMEKFGQQVFGLSCPEKIIYRPTKSRQIPEPYVCIAVQASCTVKTWLNPDGWSSVVNYLKKLGYRVLCIDKNREQSDHGFTVKMPEGAEDFTGDLPLSERINLLAYSDFFIGLSSGLAWLAWAADVPVVLISGITAPDFEFSTPYRVVNRLVCFGCHNDIDIAWPSFETCPNHRDTDRAFECSRKISARQVINAVNRLIDDKQKGRFAYPAFL